MKILLIEDDRITADFVANGLRERGHAVETADNGRDGLLLAAGSAFDLLIVDRMLPGLDGLALVKTARSAGVKVPVLFLTALGSVDERVAGLNAGGDDYLVKPFAFAELLARIDALCRRPTLQDQQTLLRCGDLEVDLLKRKVRRCDRAIDLQPREFDLLTYMLHHAGQVVTRTMLLEHVWELHFDPKTNVVETHISRLRSKIDKGFDVELIHTVRGAGYLVRAPG
jgi:Response regulators consisting of a CheY-like receiver domain and a winged-helix DNA-binding domain